MGEGSGDEPLSGKWAVCSVGIVPQFPLIHKRTRDGVCEVCGCNLSDGLVLHGRKDPLGCGGVGTARAGINHRTSGRDSLEAPCSHQFCDMDILREQKCVLSVRVLFSGLDSFCSSHSAAAGQEMFPDEESFPAL